VWDGTRWLDGAPAVQFILSNTGDSPLLIPVEATIAAPRPSSRPRGFADFGAPATVPNKSIEKYLAKLPTGLGEGQQRDCHAFRFACFLVRDLAQSDAVALAWLLRWDALQAVSKGERRLAEIIANARKYGQHAIGGGQRPRPERQSGIRHFVITSRGRIG